MRRSWFPLPGWFGLLLFVGSCVAQPAWAAITCTKQGGATSVYTCTAISDGSGDATGTVSVSGFILRVVTVPDGTATPTANWDCVLADANGVADVLGGALANRDSGDTGAAEQAFPLAPDGASYIWPFVQGTATVTCENMGDTNTATILFYVQE